MALRTHYRADAGRDTTLCGSLSAEAGRDTKLWFVCDYCSYLLLPSIPKTINIYQNCIIDFAEEFTILQPRTCCNQLKIGVHQTNLYWTFKAQQI